MAEYVASIDQGTTSTRCMLFDRNGSVINVAQKEHKQIYPQPGWVEHNPMEIWEATQYVIEEVVKNSGLKSGDIVAIGITNQR
jgi:glycerol kinase